MANRTLSWSEAYIYIYGLGLLQGEIAQIANGFAVADASQSYWQQVYDDFRTHFKDRWNILDLTLIVTIGVIAHERLPFVLDQEKIHEENLRNEYDGLMWQGDETHWYIAFLCLLTYSRMMYVGTLHPNLGPLIISLFHMEKDIFKFVVIALIFLFGFAAALVPMFSLDPT